MCQNHSKSGPFGNHPVLDFGSPLNIFPFHTTHFMICSQVALAIRESLRSDDTFDIKNLVGDVDNVAISALVDCQTTSIFEDPHDCKEERHDCDKTEKCDVSQMSTTSDGDDGSCLSVSGESVSFVLSIVTI